MSISRRGLLGASAFGATGLLTAKQVRAADQTIVVGCSITLSGPAAATGITTQRTLEHAVELINAQGIQIGPDRYTMKLQFYDNKYVPAEAVTVVEKMLADNVRFLVS